MSRLVLLASTNRNACFRNVCPPWVSLIPTRRATAYARWPSVKCLAIALAAASELSRGREWGRRSGAGKGGRKRSKGTSPDCEWFPCPLHALCFTLRCDGVGSRAAIRQMFFVPVSSHAVSAAVARCIIGLQAREKFVCVARALGTWRRGGRGRLRGRRGNPEGILVRVQSGRVWGATAAMRARVHYICGEDEVKMPIRAVEPE
ncbi:hypothetical protein K438DRAFT_1765273 [Mycena galopus ATCC 62051]|nr:hypothetical protein K438DRAFT_1765273 [Mycena galopus ATCC 62051]